MPLGLAVSVVQYERAQRPMLAPSHTRTKETTMRDHEYGLTMGIIRGTGAVKDN